MISVQVTVKDSITPLTRRQIRQLRQYPDQAADRFRELTPRRTGNARSQTKLRNQVIEADYPYAQRLDTGWSRQAPQGMTVPFDKWVRQQMKKIFGK